ncbi:TPA: hypothetical protein KN209_001232 [Clostridioides difficile]|uniref:Uncharacterized protein n=3 Tax=Bacillota TaxID=1239 RepID=A0AAN6A5B6_CLODI|nr:hypothetical protein [Clostridioides difficile]EQG51902.1 TetR family transcriptional regulator [Clostridioides difficile DA00134]EQK29494.1 TetR family transcriptional regulator [Clostridioides difficile P75]MDU2621702.1 hypothetical protein [Streptococcus lutetiensis]CCL66764.1 conserved hypothetical protein [Clostridioides difficile E7]ALP05681.1 hypothetical protein PCZ31_3796 [Clostridioides difficile]
MTHMSADKLLLGFHLDHVSNLNELLRKVAHNNICIMSDRMTKVAVWKPSVKTIQLVCMEYLNYIIDHSVIYEKIQCANWNGTEETNSIFNNSPSPLITLIYSCDLQQNKTT